MKKILKLINVRALIYAFLIWLNLNITGIQNLYFSEGNLSTIIIVKILHLIFLYAIFTKIHSLFTQRHIKKVKQEIMISAIYLLILTIFVILVWPGTWSSDDISVLRNAESYVFTPWQHFFSGLFQILCLQTIPIPTGVIIMQTIIASLIVGYCITNISNLYGKNEKQVRILQIIFVLIMLLPPVVLYILSGFRMGMYTYLELALITKLIILFKEQKKITIVELLKISFITIVISCWRTEGLYYPVLVLILFLILGDKVIRKKVAIITFMLIMTTNFSIGKLNNYLIRTNDYQHNPHMKYNMYNNPIMKSNNYSITATMEPVTQLIKVCDESDKQEIEVINKVLDVEFILENPNNSGERNFWIEGVVRDYSDEEYSNYLKAYLKLAIKYPDITFRSMWNIFEKAGSGMGNDSKQATRNMVSGRDTLEIFELGEYSWRKWSAVTSRVSKYTQPINLTVRNAVINFMNGTDSNGKITIIHNIFWNFFIPFALLLYSLIYKFIKKDWFMVFIILAIAARIPLVFATAPAPYFMYYLSTYLCAYIVSTIVIFEMITNKKENSSEKIFDKRTFLYSFLIWLNLNISGIQNIYFTDEKSFAYMLVKVLHLVFLYLIIDKIRSLYKNRQTIKGKNEIIISITYFVILTILLVIVWPGIWNIDDITVLRNAENYDFTPEQHFFSGMFQILCLQTIGIPSGVIIVQALIGALIVGHCIANIVEVFGKTKKQKRIVQIALIIITLLPPFLINGLSGSYIGIYSYLELALITQILKLYKKQEKATLLDIIKISFLTVIISCWRLEGIFYPLLVLILYFSLGNKVVCKKVAVIAFIVVMLINSLFGAINYLLGGSNNYVASGDSNTLELYNIGTATWVKWSSITSRVEKFKTPINVDIRNNVISALYRTPISHLSIHLCVYVIAFIIIFEFIIRLRNRKSIDKDSNEIVPYKKSKKEIVKKIFKQFMSFLLVSGVGWIMDFSIYFVLTHFANFNVGFANILSSIPAITYVFIMSNKKIFENLHSKLSLKIKYLIYFAYQLLLLLSISLFGEFLYNKLVNLLTIEFLLNNLKIFIKILITPITMTINFIVMKNLIEKL